MNEKLRGCILQFGGESWTIAYDGGRMNRDLLRSLLASAVREYLAGRPPVREVSPTDPAIDLRTSIASAAAAGVQDTDDFTDAVMADVRGETGR